MLLKDYSNIFFAKHKTSSWKNKFCLMQTELRLTFFNIALEVLKCLHQNLFKLNIGQLASKLVIM